MFIVTCRELQACYSIKLSTIPTLRSSYVPESWRKLDFAQVGIQNTSGQVYIYIKGRPVGTRNQTQSNLIDLSMTVPPIVIAQQYYSTTYVSLRFHLRKGNFDARFNSASFSFFFLLLKIALRLKIVWRRSVRGECLWFTANVVGAPERSNS